MQSILGQIVKRAETILLALSLLDGVHQFDSDRQCL